MANETTNNSTSNGSSGKILTNGVKLVGEAVVPGASLLLDGKVIDGAAHVVVGLAARLLLGPIGLLVVAADSYSKSVAGRSLWDYASSAVRKEDPAPKVASPAVG